MFHHTEVSSLLAQLDPTTVKTNKGITYYNLACGFDIETTSTYVNDEKAAFMYIWQLGIGHGNGVMYGRTWQELVDTLDIICKHFDTTTEHRIVIYVHNLGYEFQFIRHYFDWVDLFAIDERKPLKAVTSTGIEFRCSYLLSGFSLDGVARNLTKHKINKQVGDLDYSLLRHHKTPLTPEEEGYCRSDIQIVTAYIDEQLEYYGDIAKIPATNTGRVRSYVRNECYYTSKNHRKSNSSKYVKYRKIMDDLTLTPNVYVQLKRAFMGGFTHANATKSGKVIKDVSSIDFTSSYPAVMVSEKFPMTRFRPYAAKSEKDLQILLANNAVVFDARFHGLRCKISHETYISESKCYELSKAIIDNGRVVDAEVLATTITDVDYDIMRQVYEWDSIDVANVHFAPKAYLPKAIIKSILDIYQDKTELKDVKGKETEYVLSKGMLNSIYGMSVTDVVKDNAIYDGADWSIEPVDMDDEIHKYNTSKNRFLFYPWGIWVTAYARRNLWTGIMAVGNDYVYADTDSLKLENIEKHKGYIDWFDGEIIEKMAAACNHYGFSTDLLYPKTIEGVVKPLGIWDFEGTYDHFKTLGAKRYLVHENGKLHLTVAGLSKQNGINYLLEQAGGDVMKVFDLFNHDLYIPANRTGKMTHTYIDTPQKFKVTDYYGQSAVVETLSSVHLEECDFTLKLSNDYMNFLETLSKGYMLTGEVRA